jgi:ATP-dependent Clp protease ATP-binding subunit ClpC
LHYLLDYIQPRTVNQEKNNFKEEQAEKTFGYLYFKDPLVELPKTFRFPLLLISFAIWGLITLVSFLGILFGIFHILENGNFEPNPVLSFFWLGILLMFYVIHHLYKSKKSWRSLLDLEKKENLSNIEINIAEYFNPKSKKVLSLAYDESRITNDPLELILFKVLLSTPETEDFLNHLELDPATINSEFRNKIKTFNKDYELSKEPPRQTLEGIVQRSFVEAYSAGSSDIRSYHFLMALFSKPHPVIEDLFLKHNIELEDARNVAIWLRVKSSLIISRTRPRRVKHKVMNRAFTAKPTYFLDNFSDDLTDLARHGIFASLVGHQEEYQETINILNQDSRNNALIVGSAGSGRQAIINELARRISIDDIPKNLYDKRLVCLDAGSMLAGLKTPGELQERLQKIMDEIVASKNIILGIPQIHDLIRAVENQSLSFMSFFGPVFESVNFPLIASTDEANYHQLIEKRSDLAGTFNIVKIKEISREDAFKFLIREAIVLEKQGGIAIGHFAIKEALDLSERFIKNRLLPSKAYDLLTQAAEEAKTKGKKFITREDIGVSLSKSTGIPVGQASAGEAKELLNLEEKLHEKMIDQEPAVKAVSEVLRQARAGLERRTGPIGTFLFVGPTGVGKTELAKALAETYFGGEERMVRFDMSEYQSADSIYRLIGTKDSGGFLTEKIKNQPFCLLLLDEFEKAYRDVLNLFLQVFEDGRITDELGNVVDFTNTIIIATSNAHAVLIQEKLKEGMAIPDLQKLIREKLTDIYRPELLNRFDEVIVFKTLEAKELEQIAILKLKSLFTRLEEEQSVKFSITPDALRKISELGYDPQNGARPIRRAISKYINNLIANAVLTGELKKGENYSIDFVDNKFVIKGK